MAGLPEVRERFTGQGGEARASSRVEFSNLVEKDLARWRQVVLAANIKVE